jgi:effector-binding domain-containing protein
VLVVALAAAFGFGFFFLTPSVTISDRVSIDRPRATVFSVVANLQTAPEWSAWLVGQANPEFDPQGMSGSGQKATWRRSVNNGGEGGQVITKAVPYSEVSSVISLGRRGEVTSAMSLAPEAGATQVDWRMTLSCGQSPLSVTCRYISHFLIKPSIQKDMTASHANLKQLVERLSKVDFEGLDPDIVQQPAGQNFAYMESDVSREGRSIEVAALEMFAAVEQFLREKPTIEAVDRVLWTIRDSGDRMVFRAGYVVRGLTPEIASDPRVKVEEAPHGRALRFMFEGPRAELPRYYEKIAAYIQANRVRTSAESGPWEVRRAPTMATSPSGEPNLRVDIFYPLN